MIMEINPILKDAMGSLKGEAQKSLNGNLKKIAEQILEHQKGVRLGKQKLEEEIQERQKAIEILNAQAASLIADFNEVYGGLEKVKAEG